MSVYFSLPEREMGHPQKTKATKNPLDLNHVIVEARQLAHFYLSTNRGTFDSGN
jgi:hypothetical protein